MNAARRKSIDEVKAKLEALRSTISEIHDEIESIQSEEQDALDNMPDSFRDGEKGEKAQAAINSFDEAMVTLDGFDVDDVINALDEASNA